MNKSLIYSAEDLRKLRRQARTFQDTFEDVKFGEDGHIMAFNFLTKFFQEDDILDVSKTHALFNNAEAAERKNRKLFAVDPQ